MSTGTNDDVIARTEPRLEASRLDAFRRAVAASAPGFPPSFPTIFRFTEFAWLDRTSIDMRQLLHTEQEYEYVEELRAGDVPEVSTRVKSMKERAGMKFITLETRVECEGKLKALATTTFVVRPKGA